MRQQGYGGWYRRYDNLSYREQAKQRQTAKVIAALPYKNKDRVKCSDGREGIIKGITLTLKGEPRASIQLDSGGGITSKHFQRIAKLTPLQLTIQSILRKAHQ